jgi:hypothetical protein
MPAFRLAATARLTTKVGTAIHSPGRGKVVRPGGGIGGSRREFPRANSPEYGFEILSQMRKVRIK